MEVASGKESREKDVEGERMTEEEFNNQHNRFGRFVTFNDQLYIGPLNNEMNGLERMWRHSQQQQKRLDKMLTESYAENRNLRDTIKTLQEQLRSSPGADPATTESTQRNITLHPNPNERAQAREDLFAFFNKNCFVPKSTKESTGSPQPDVVQQSMNPIDRQVVTDQKQVLTDSLVSVSLFFFGVFAFHEFSLATTALYTILFPQSHSFILFFTFTLLIHSRNSLYILFF